MRSLSVSLGVDFKLNRGENGPIHRCRASCAVLNKQTNEVAAHNAVGCLAIPRSIPTLLHHRGETKFILPNSDFWRCPH
jgi:hypothetical protein